MERRHRRPYVLSIANQKGGVGKTTMTVCLAEALAQKGQRVLVIDYDGQANLTSWVLGRPLTDDEVSILDVLVYEDYDLATSAEPAPAFGFDFIGATSRLFGLEGKFAGDSYSFRYLRDAVQILKENADEMKGPFGQGAASEVQETEDAQKRPYDFCLIDCPPALGLAATQALNASDGVLIPTLLEKMPVEGLKRLTDEIGRAQALGGSRVEVVGVVPNIVHVIRSQSREIAGVLRARFGEAFLEACQVPVRTRVSEASAMARPLRQHCETHESDEYVHYERLAEAVIERTIGASAAEPSA